MAVFSILYLDMYHELQNSKLSEEEERIYNHAVNLTHIFEYEVKNRAEVQELLKNKAKEIEEDKNALPWECITANVQNDDGSITPMSLYNPKYVK